MTARSKKSTFKGTSVCSCSFTEHFYVQMELYRGLLAEAHGDCMSDKSGVGSQQVMICLCRGKDFCYYLSLVNGQTRRCLGVQVSELGSKI